MDMFPFINYPCIQRRILYVEFSFDLNLILSVTSHINCIVAHCLINFVYLMAMPLSGHDDVAFFE